MIREALKSWLEPEKDLQIIGTADNGITALEQVEKLHPDVVLMDLEMPDLDGASATQFITNRFSDTKVVILSSDDSDEYVAKTLSMGAKGYLLKNADSQDIATAIRSAHKGYTQIAPGLLEKVLIKTDSGMILSKLNRPTTIKETSPTIEDNLVIGREKQFITQSKRAILSLQSASRKQRAELERLRNNLDLIQPEITAIARIPRQNSRQIKLMWILLITSISIIALVLLSIYNKINQIEKNTIPIERVGLYGEYNLSGLAQRVASTFARDFVLSNISSVYVAQRGNTIILKGTIPDATLIQRMENVAKEVRGVNEVDTSQVIVF
jgi:DNA-binding NarL/FixJ family response regulator